MKDADDAPLGSVLDRIRQAAEGDSVTVREVLQKVGENSFATALLTVALVTVTPLSGIPTVPTISAIVISVIVLQWMLGREHLWVPDWILRRSVASSRVRSAVDWLDRPAAFIDRHTKPRFHLLTQPPFSILALMIVLMVVATWPFLELLPLFTTVCAVGVALVAFSLMTEDGLWMIAGLCYWLTLAGIIFTIF